MLVDLAEQRSRRRPLTIIEHERDPEFPNRNFFLIKSETREAVQFAIDGIIAGVETFTFIGPRRSQSGCFFAIGETVDRG